MRTRKVFVASSMSYDALRGEMDNIISSINEDARRYKIKDDPLESCIYGKTTYGDGSKDQQQVINNHIKGCDIFLLLVKCGDEVGEISLMEYKLACKSCLCVKTFVICSPLDDNNKRTEYINSISPKLDGEKRYISVIEEGKFEEGIKKYLNDLIFSKLYFHNTQDELSYGKHISNIKQEFRKYDQKYYRRQRIDDYINDILSKSSLIIFEGNTYSGKTRAAYELMKGREDWKNHSFYVYTSYNCVIDNLNSISINNGSPEVIFIDDINSIIEGVQENIGNTGIWGALQNIVSGVTPQLDNTTIIITISGTLSQIEKSKVYTKIFGESYYAMADVLKSVTVNFDELFTKEDFRIMVSEMVREGIISRNVVRPGNYTIGSLFIDIDKIKTRIRELSNENDDVINLFKSVLLLRMFSKVELRESRESILSIFCGVFNYPRNIFNKTIEKLRANALIMANNDKVIIDPFILTYVSNEADYTISNEEIKRLIIYIRNNIFQDIYTYERIGYLLCDRNILPDARIEYIVGCISNMLYPNNIMGDILDKCIEICRMNRDSRNTYNFCAKAISGLSDFQTIIDLMLDLEYNFNDEDIGEICRRLYKETIYSLLSTQRGLSYSQECSVLDIILNKEGGFKEPFCEDDLRHIITLRRMIPYLDYDVDKILNLAASASLTTDGSQTSGKLRLTRRNTSATISSDEQVVLISQLGKLCLSLLERCSSYDEFRTILEKIKDKAETSDNIRRATSEYFTSSIYKKTSSIIELFNYQDKRGYGEFLMEVVDKHGVTGNLDIQDDNVVNEHKSLRIKSLNELLPVLDESDSLQLYQKMKERNLKDPYSFSMLITNPTLGYEHLIHLYENETKSFLINNQLLDKAPNKTETKICLGLMGIPDLDPSNLKSEEALGSYIKKSDVTYQEVVDIVRNWKGKDYNKGKTLNDITLGQITSKMSYEKLKSLFESSSILFDCLEEKEIKRIKENPICISHLFTKGRSIESEKEYLREKYKSIDKNLLFNPEYNSNDGIVSPYIQNEYINDDIDALIKFVDGVIDGNPSFSRSYFIYKALLQRIVYDKNYQDKVNQVNQILSKAYSDFSDHCTKDEVKKKMAHLYVYRVILTSQKEYSQEQDYFCDGRVEKCDFGTFLQMIIENNIFVNGVFINEILKGMTDSLDDTIYAKTKTIAKQNNIGILIEGYNKLPEHIQNKLINITGDTIGVDRELISHFSPIKLLWWLLRSQKITYLQAKKYLNDYPNIEETQTYLNIAFKAIAVGYYLSLKKASEELKELMKKVNESTTLYFSIEMYLAMLKLLDVDTIISITGKNIPAEYLQDPHIIDSLMRNHISKYIKPINSDLETRTSPDDLISKLRSVLVDNMDNLNITIINSYICGLLIADKTDILENIWSYLEKNNMIDLNVVLGLESGGIQFQANAQTYIYFPNHSSITCIDEKFGGNFNYDGNKSCLYDALKNYKSYLAKKKKSWNKKYIEKVVVILERDEHKNIRKSIYNKYILKNHKNIVEFWFNLVKESEIMKGELAELYTTHPGVANLKDDRKREIEDIINNN